LLLTSPVLLILAAALAAAVRRLEL